MHILRKLSNQSGYSAKYPTGIKQDLLDGGAPRSRRTTRNQYRTVNVNWTCKDSDFQYLLAFYEVWTRNPNQPFYTMLVVDSPELKAYKCQFAADSFSLDGTIGVLHRVSAQVYAKPVIDKDLNNLIVAAWDEEVDLSAVVNPLELLVNLWLPTEINR